jgi:hypothetical protein
MFGTGEPYPVGLTQLLRRNHRSVHHGACQCGRCPYGRV